MERDDLIQPGDVVDVEPVFELSEEAMAYLASGAATFAPEPTHG